MTGLMLALSSANGDAIDAVTILFILVALGCLVAAGFAGYRGAWLPCGLLVVVAIIAAAIAF